MGLSTVSAVQHVEQQQGLSEADLSDGDVVLVAEVQGSTGLAGLNEKLHPLLTLPVLQEEVSCAAG